MFLNFSRNFFQYCIYREIRFSNDSDGEGDDGDECDVTEVKEYAGLVGTRVSERMLLYRS